MSRSRSRRWIARCTGQWSRARLRPIAGSRRSAIWLRAGIPTGASIAPIVPGLTDHEIERLVQTAADAGASYANYIALRLPLEVSPLFRDWLAREFPDRAARVMARVQEMHGGKDYDANWHTRRSGTGVYANMIKRRFQMAARRHGLDRPGRPLRTDLFRVPPRSGDQLALGI